LSDTTLCGLRDQIATGHASTHARPRPVVSTGSTGGGHLPAPPHLASRLVAGAPRTSATVGSPGFEARPWTVSHLSHRPRQL